MAFDGSYPAPPGNKRWSIIDVAGPASYVQATLSSGVAPTGGQTVSAAQAGLTAIENATVSRSDDGMFSVQTFMSPFNLNQSSPAIIMRWIVNSTGAEVAGGVDLSARKVRVHMFGAY